jgi:3-oxoacyl-[acyl-carrier protein] reductase/L-fucose dehydrogenase
VKGIVKVLAGEGAIPVIIGRNEADNLNYGKGSGGGRRTSLAGGGGTILIPRNAAKPYRLLLTRYGRIEGLVNNAGVNDGIGWKTAIMKTLWLPA